MFPRTMAAVPGEELRYSVMDLASGEEVRQIVSSDHCFRAIVNQGAEALARYCEDPQCWTLEER